MNINETLLPEIDMEFANTRKALERVPTDKMDFKPHEKSGTLGWLAGHCATIAQWGATTLTTDSLVADDFTPPPQPTTTEELLEVFDKHAGEFRAAVAAASNEDLMKHWKMVYKGHTVFDMPRVAVLRGMILNHLIHHRGQLTVYLRLNDIPVPALYGPSADEGQFGGGA